MQKNLSLPVCRFNGFNKFRNGRDSAAAYTGDQKAGTNPLVGGLTASLNFRYDKRKSAQQATMAIRELGANARQRAVKQLKEFLTISPPKHSTGDNPARYLLELVWLGNEKDLMETEDILHSKYQYAWENIKPLIPLNKADDEGAFLIDLMREPVIVPYGEIRNWVIFRLGDLKDKRAIPIFVDYLARINDTRFVEQALKTIGGREVEEAMLGLLPHEEKRVRGMATEVLLNLQGKRSLSAVRRMVMEENFGDRQRAFSYLHHHGTLEDLEMLKPFCNFWERSDSSIYWPCAAVSGIRLRFDYDINGRIKKIVGDPTIQMN